MLETFNVQPRRGDDEEVLSVQGQEGQVQGALSVVLRKVWAKWEAKRQCVCCARIFRLVLAQTFGPSVIIILIVYKRPSSFFLVEEQT